jgi:carbonic anhydrase
MKKVKFLMIVLLVAAVSTSISAQKKVDPTGTWTYKAAEAPYEYSSGDIVVAKDGKDFTAEIVLGEYYKVKASSVTYENNELAFKIYIEGESVSVKATVGKENMEGTASYSDGTIPITAQKKEN